jgi:DNA-binding transcriptional MerR regulator
MKLLTTNEVLRLSGLSRSMLRRFIYRKFITPAVRGRTAKNGGDRFSYAQTWNLIVAGAFHIHLGYSLARVKQLLAHEPSEERLLEILTPPPVPWYDFSKPPDPWDEEVKDAERANRPPLPPGYGEWAAAYFAATDALYRHYLKAHGLKAHGSAEPTRPAKKQTGAARPRTTKKTRTKARK